MRTLRDAQRRQLDAKGIFSDRNLGRYEDAEVSSPVGHPQRYAKSLSPLRYRAPRGCTCKSSSRLIAIAADHGNERRREAKQG